MSEVPWTEASAIGVEAARQTWALAARMALEETASRYHAVITDRELADYVQERSRIRTKQAPRHWIGDVLWRTMERAHEDGEPFLAALCVDSSGRVDGDYAGRVQHLRGTHPGDPQTHAAEERLDCYRRFGAVLPPDGGEPGPMPRAAPERRAATSGEPRARSRGTRAAAVKEPARRKPSEAAPKICQRCFMALPASGICDTCD